MNKELKAKWVAALRSGNYEQGRNTLRSADNRYCCLGVLLCVKGSFRPAQLFMSGEGDLAVYQYMDGLLGKSDADQRQHRHRLAEMNDHQDKTFGQIADYIEATL